MIKLKKNPRAMTKEEGVALFMEKGANTDFGDGKTHRIVLTQPNRSRNRGGKIRKGYKSPPPSNHQKYTGAPRPNWWI